MAEDVSTFVDAVVADARTADFVRLIASGRSEDDIFEIAVIAAVATGTQRALSGLAALEKA